jgi:hypothetical protein
MIEKKRNLDWSYLLLCPYIMVAFIPRVVHYFQHRFILPLMLLWVIHAFTMRRHVQLPRQGLVCLIVAFVFLGMNEFIAPLCSLFDHGVGFNYGMISDFVLTGFPLLVFHFSVCNGRQQELRLLVFFGFCCIAVSAAMTVLGLANVEAGARALTGASGEGADLQTVEAAFEEGIGTYGHIYGMGLLLFPLLYCVTFMPVAMKGFFAGFCLLVLVAAYKAAFSILLIGLALAGLLFLVMKLSRSLALLKAVGIVFIVVVITVLANPRILSFTLNPLLNLVGMTNQMEYQSRIESVADMISGDEDAYASFRTELYWRSWNVFLKHPFFGIGNYYSANNEMLDTGGHSLLFDTLAVWGIFGVSIFVLFFVFLQRYMRAMSFAVLGFKWWPAYYIFLFSAGTIAIVNPIGGAIVYSDLLFFIPSLVLFFRRNDSGMRIRPEDAYPQQIRQPTALRQKTVGEGSSNEPV